MSGRLVATPTLAKEKKICKNHVAIYFEFSRSMPNESLRANAHVVLRGRIAAQLSSYIFLRQILNKSQILLSMIPIIRIIGKDQRASNMVEVPLTA